MSSCTNIFRYIGPIFIVIVLFVQPSLILQAYAATAPLHGIYESCIPKGATNDCLARLDKMAAGGFKLVVNYAQMYGDAAGEIAYLDHAESLGMKVIFAINDTDFRKGISYRSVFPGLAATCGCTDNTSFLQYSVNLVKNHPAVWGYYIGDEVRESDHDALKRDTDLIKQFDPNHPRLLIQSAEITGGGTAGAKAALTPFVDTADVLGIDYYPIGSWGNNESVAQTGTMAAAVQAVADRFGRQSAMVLQSFSWSQYPDQAFRCPGSTFCPYPSVSDMQQMVQLTLQNASPSIILWYSYYDIFRADNPTQRWDNLATVVKGSPAPTTLPTRMPTQVATQTPTRVATSAPTIPHAQTTLFLTLFLHGIGKGGDNLNPISTTTAIPLRQTRIATVELYNTSNQRVLSTQATVAFQPATGNFTGTIDGGNVISGVYIMKVQVPQYLKKAIAGILSLSAGQSNQIPAIYLTTGDSNNDNRLSILDYNLLLDCFSVMSPARNCADQTKKQAADLTDDGIVSQFDYNLFLRELSIQIGE
jgi:hypothetical protein